MAERGKNVDVLRQNRRKNFSRRTEIQHTNCVGNRKEAVPLDGERCPCCGREVVSFLYLRGGEVVGCDGCVAAWDLWELPRAVTEPEGRWEDGRTA